MEIPMHVYKFTENEDRLITGLDAGPPLSEREREFEELCREMREREIKRLAKILKKTLAKAAEAGH